MLSHQKNLPSQTFNMYYHGNIQNPLFCFLRVMSNTLSLLLIVTLLYNITPKHSTFIQLYAKVEVREA